ncbi:hypothetical protein AB835_01520 [Candidatus Endobugula sertula]|uniref:MobA/VirD2-like nuclease domain-containing protein n=1 Tax=Candidatus Endobugula sertula TaxID=62101 RepID=A0A1D2QT45_9GAMM|nr:hypothetical protein AB835_01520 [Candidatus Endobugula sertula]
MILKGNQRGGGRQMALHLLNTQQNDHVEVHQVRGFIADDVLGALNETYALSKGTKCKQYMYSLSLNPPEEAKTDYQLFDQTIDRAEKTLGLENQPRIIVFHEKEGRRHAHCVWSRINIEEMKAINMSYDHDKLHTLSKKLFIEHDWKLPPGFIDKNQKSPLNFSREEWQQALRTGQKAADIKAHLQECWAASDSKPAFEQALREKGYFLARGDRRGYVAVDSYGEVYSLPHKLEKTAKDLTARLGNPKHLATVAEQKAEIAKRFTPKITEYQTELQNKHQEQKNALLQEKQTLVNQQRQARQEQAEHHKQRQQQEGQQRAERLRKGFKGLWDRLTGKHSRTCRQNEHETQQCQLRDQQEKQKLITEQLQKRQKLQTTIKQTQEQHNDERLEFYQTVEKHHQQLDKQEELSQLLEEERDYQQSIQSDMEQDFKPEM